MVLPLTDTAASRDQLQLLVEKVLWPDTRVTFYKVAGSQREGSVDKILAMQALGTRI